MNYICRVLDYIARFWFMEWLILVHIINRIINGRLEIWNLSSRVHIRYLTRSLRSLVRYRCEHSKINSISPRDHVLFSIYFRLPRFIVCEDNILNIGCYWEILLRCYLSIPCCSSELTMSKFHR